MKRATWLCVGVVALAGVAMRPCLSSEGPIRFIQTNARAVTGTYEVKWTDEYDGTLINDGPLPSLTWYYATKKDGSDRRRMTTFLRDDFKNGFRRNWRISWPFVQQPKVSKDERRGLHYFSGRPDASPAVSEDPAPKDVVISALVRPHPDAQEFAIGGRVQANGVGYEIRGSGGGLRVLLAGRPKPLCERPFPHISPGKVPDSAPDAKPVGDWYWYELGVRTRKKREVEIHVRVFDAERKQLLVSFPAADRPQNGDLLKGGRISLWGKADFAEICVDPWSARYIEDETNSFHWDTSDVPNGDYYLLAEVVDCKGQRLQVSPFKVEVRNPDRGGRD